MKDTMIGVGLAKNVFPVHSALRTGEVQFRTKLTRKPFPVFMAQQEPCTAILEACCGAHYWARQMEALGNEVKLIAPQYVHPFVKLCAAAHNFTYHQVAIMRRKVRILAVCRRFRSTFLHIISERVEPGEQARIPFP